MATSPQDRAAATAAAVSDRARAALSDFNNSLDPEDRAALLERRTNAHGRGVWRLFLLGVLFTPLPLIGAALGFRRAYDRVLRPQRLPPRLGPLHPAARWAMIVGAVLVPLIALAVVLLLALFGFIVFRSQPGSFGRIMVLIVPYLTLTVPLSGLVMLAFTWWVNTEWTRITEGDRYGSARFALPKETRAFSLTDAPAPLDAPQSRQDRSGAPGFFMGHDDSGRPLFYPRQGHFLTVAGTRGGKGVNLIVPNLLLDSLGGSWVVVDPKGENAVITAPELARRGKRVILLNPWGLLADDFAARGFSTFGTLNPLDLLASAAPLNLVDDVEVLAEMIVPMKAEGGAEESHWTTRARALVSGLLLHLVTSDDHKHERNLSTLYRWLRLPAGDDDQPAAGDDAGVASEVRPALTLQRLIVEMIGNAHPVAGPAVQGTADAFGNLMVKGEREFASILSTAQRWTEFLKSPALAASMASTSFDLSALSRGDVALFVIIPTDRLKTASQWLRLVVTATMRSVVRNPDRRVCFLLDEAYALGYVSEIEIALGTYAGFNVSVWSIYQNLTQLRDLWGVNWENFLASSAVRHFFNVGDQFSADYLSRFMGTSTIVDTTATGQLKGVSSRPLLNPDEVRRGSRDQIFTFIEQEFPAALQKAPYYDQPELAAAAASNPYFKG